AAHASWHNTMSIHGGKLQLCKIPLSNGRVKVKVRLDNRKSSHTHLGGVSRTRDGQRRSIDFRTGAGRLSPTKSLIRKPGDYLSAGMGEPSGEGAGGDFLLSSVTRC
ncbi:MAG: hypothetical protein WBP61_17375, partial [Nocardioides sp.]